MKDIFFCCPNKIYKLKSILISNQNMFRVQEHFLSKFPPLYFTLHSRRSKYFVFLWLGEVVLHGRKGVSDCFANEKESKSSHFHYFIKILNFVHKKIIIIVSYGFTKVLNCYESKKTKLKMHHHETIIFSITTSINNFILTRPQWSNNFNNKKNRTSLHLCCIPS